MAMLIDLTPRLAFVLMFPVGFELATAMGVLQPTGTLRMLVWGAAVA